MQKVIEYIVQGWDNTGTAHPSQQGIAGNFYELPEIAREYKEKNPRVCRICIDMALPMDETNS